MTKNTTTTTATANDAFETAIQGMRASARSGGSERATAITSFKVKDANVINWQRAASTCSGASRVALLALGELASKAGEGATINARDVDALATDVARRMSIKVSKGADPFAFVSYGSATGTLYYLCYENVKRSDTPRYANTVAKSSALHAMLNALVEVRF